MGYGPILIFDKSALQALSVDESVMLDHFFLTNITPIFFIEALGDLQKLDARGRTSEQAVTKDLAAKVPDDVNSNVFHRTLLEQDLLGNPVPMTGQIVIPHGTPKPDEHGGVSVVVEEPPEAEMVRRWQAGQYDAAEHGFAAAWRAGLLNVSFKKKIEEAKWLLPPTSPRDLQGLKSMVDQFLQRNDRGALTFVLRFLGVSEEYVAIVDQRHASSGRPAINEFARYAAFVAGLDLVFYLGLATGLIRSNRNTNLVDLSYLYYLPFCMVFTSRDRFHEELAPIFMRPAQRFVWGADLKAGLKVLNEYYAPMRERMGRLGLMRVHQPPSEPRTIVSELWENCLRLDGTQPDEERATGAHSDDDLLARINRIIASNEVLPADALVQQPDSVIVQRRMALRRGSWQAYPQTGEEEPADAHGSRPE